MKIFKAILFWLWSCTWGCLMTLVGAVVALGCLVTGHKPHLFHQNVYFRFGTGGWGFNAGPFFFLSKDCGESLHMKQHESGHGLQNLIFGPLTPFLVAIPSCIRFWYREWVVSSGRKKSSELPAYDAIWFEGTATRWGEKVYKD